MTDPRPLMQTESEDDRVTIRLHGEIDLSNADGLETEIERATAGAHDVIIDLTGIEFMDSRALRLLMRISTTTAQRDASLTVHAPPDSIARSLLDITHMSHELTVRD